MTTKNGKQHSFFSARSEQLCKEAVEVAQRKGGHDLNRVEIITLNVDLQLEHQAAMTDEELQRSMKTINNLQAQL